MSFRKAEKSQGKLRLAIGGPAGTGKTWTSLAIATEIGRLTRESGLGEGRIAVIDSERGSSELYADRFDFDVCNLDSFSPLEYVAKIREAEREGYDVIVVDSLSHAWAGKDGALEQQGRAAQSSDKWRAWAQVTPKQNALIDALTGSGAHVIATMRQKTEYVSEKDEAGKTVIRKVGLQFVQRDQVEFEFTLVGEIDIEHTMTISKTRVDSIPLNAQIAKPGETFARQLWQWLRSGKAPAPRQERQPEPSADVVSEQLSERFREFLREMVATTTLAELDAVVGGPGKPQMGTAERAKANEVYGVHRKALLEKQQQAAASSEAAS